MMQINLQQHWYNSLQTSRWFITLPDGVDNRRFNTSAFSEVYTVLTLNVDHSFPTNEMAVKQRGKN